MIQKVNITSFAPMSATILGFSHQEKCPKDEQNQNTLHCKSGAQPEIAIKLTS
jgi:hypothetical protein